MKTNNNKTNLTTNIRQIARKLSEIFDISKPNKIYPTTTEPDYLASAYQLDNQIEEELAFIECNKELYKKQLFVDNEGVNDDYSTVCLTNVSSLCSTDSMENDALKKSMLFDPDKFNIISILGSGTYGNVFLATYENGSKEYKDRKRYAVKKLSKNNIDKNNIKQIMDEKNILLEMDNPFILRLYGTCQTDNELCLITELVECGELFTAIYEDEKLSHESCVFYSACIILALDHIHSKGVIFRDLKPENIMIDSLGYPRIVDFGLTKHLPYLEICDDGTIRKKTHCMTICGTPEYFAPEIIFNDGYNQMVDVWAVGVIMYEMIVCKHPFSQSNLNDMTQLFTNIAQVKKNGILLSKTVDKKADGLPNARNLITQLLSGDPKKRLGNERELKNLLKHPYFSSLSVDENAIYNRTFKPPCLQYKCIGDPLIDNYVASLTEEQYTGDQSIFENF